MAKTGSKPIDELVRLAIIGDGSAFTELWDTNIDSLHAYLKTTMKLQDDFYIDDVCSRSFEKAFRQIGSYDPTKSKFSTWLRIIAHNTALDVIESENRAKRQRVSLYDQTGAVIDVLPEDQEDTPLDSIIRDEDTNRTQACIEGLPELYREVARLRLLEGAPYKEIADKLELELNTVRTRIRRAKALIEEMKDNEQ